MEAKKREKHFWVPFFDEAGVFLLLSSSVVSKPLEIEILDCEGRKKNTIKLQLSSSSNIEVLPIEPLANGCIREGGLLHSHLVVKADEDISFFAKPYSIINRCKAVPLHCSSFGSLNKKSAVVPLYLSEKKRHCIGFANPLEKETVLSLRLSIGKRLPLEQIKVPANGSRAIVVEAAFEEVIKEENLKAPVYLKMEAENQLITGGITVASNQEKREEMVSNFFSV
ncbi:MAG: hypothetical protein D6780_08235 [Candidatus Dadabacteria bacterium]|nr:MAG: hypothetical protein D6780_08235 [Candidatus Dadabacteria bacterium]